LSAASQELQGKLDALCLEGEVLTEADLEIARQRRDAGWDLVQQVLRVDSSGDSPHLAAGHLGGDRQTSERTLSNGRQR